MREEIIVFGSGLALIIVSIVIGVLLSLPW